MKSQVDPQIPQRINQTMRAFMMLPKNTERGSSPTVRDPDTSGLLTRGLLPRLRVALTTLLVMLQVQLNDIENCALRISQHCEAADFRNICRRSIGSRPE